MLREIAGVISDWKGRYLNMEYSKQWMNFTQVFSMSLSIMKKFYLFMCYYAE